MAERAGFEPAVRFLLRRFSKPLLSATQPPLRLQRFKVDAAQLLSHLNLLGSAADTEFLGKGKITFHVFAFQVS